jgi:uncharacterized membrane protein YeaQ/YmgE (transglycosylase-associated protein family)
VLGAVAFWIVLGLLVGLVARWIIPGDPPGGVVTDAFVGIVGAAIGAWLYGPFRHVDVNGFSLPSLVCAFIGAVVLLYLLRVFRRGRSSA